MDWEARVGEGLERVRARIGRACERVDRDPADVRIVAVSKKHPPEAVRVAYGLGHREFGENYVQELVGKALALASVPDLQWRFIGHLQRNKVRDVLRVGAVVDTVDSLRLGEALSSRAQAEARAVDVLVQVNVGGEAQKAGCDPAEAPTLVKALQGLAGIRVRGLMTMPPAAPDPESTRPLFRTLRQLRDELGLEDLSMGMSGDLEVAVEEGATMVRVGSAIFGPRPQV